MSAGQVTRLRNFVSDKNSNIPITASYTDAELDQLVASLNCKVISKATAPSSPTSGDTWIDTSTTPPQLKVYDGTNWNATVLNYQASSVASATTTDIGAAIGSLVYITGTTTITGFGTVAAGTLKLVHFSGNLTLTHNATSLILKNNASDRSILAGDSGIYVSLGSGNWEEIAFQAVGGNTYVPSVSNALSGSVIQVVNTITGAAANGSTAIPLDDTIPQSTEGTQFMTLAVTPNNASNKLKIEVVANVLSDAGGSVAVALFQDSTANALAVGQIPSTGSSVAFGTVTFTHFMAAGTTSSTTFKVRAGSTSGNTYFNGGPGGTANRLFGGVIASSITITEIKA